VVTDQVVRVERSGLVSTVFLHRPARRNAVDGPTAVQLAAAFRAFDADPGAAIAVLHGEGGVFCSGAVGAAEAAAIGLANRVVPAGEALAAAQELAAELASFPQICLRSDRASMLDQEGLDEAAALASEFAHGRQALVNEAGSGAARFAAGAGRHGSSGT
jgi:enoyl-CoA hydratase/carnithine racemase